MKSTATVGIIAVIVAFAALIGLSYVSAYNTGNRLEAGIRATYENNQNILAQYSNAVAEAAQVPAMQRDDLSKVITDALNARYGENGAQAVFQAIQEQNPQIDSAVYTKIQQIIQAGRKDFEVGQTRLVDQKQVYETALGSFWKGTWMRVAGYPKIDLDDYAVVTNARTDAAFETKREEPIKIR